MKFNPIWNKLKRENLFENKTTAEMEMQFQELNTERKKKKTEDNKITTNNSDEILPGIEHTLKYRLDIESIQNLFDL